MDSQTRVEHTLGLAALVQAMASELAEHFEAGKPLSRYPHEMVDENRGWPRGTASTASSSTCPARARLDARSWPVG